MNLIKIKFFTFLLYNDATNWYIKASLALTNINTCQTIVCQPLTKVSPPLTNINTRQSIVSPPPTKVSLPLTKPSTRQTKVSLPLTKINTCQTIVSQPPTNDKMHRKNVFWANTKSIESKKKGKTIKVLMHI